MRIAVPILVFVIALGVYVATLTPSVGLVDSGALTVAAHSVGNAHPPGFPLYLMLTKLFTLLPLGSVAYRANLASAFFAALSCAMVSLIAFELAGDKRDRVSTLIAAFAGLLLAFSRTLWGYATVAEVYALNTFLIAAIVWLMLSWRRTRDVRRLYAAAFVFGLALGVHHVTVGLTLLGIAVLVFRTDKKIFSSKRLAIAAGLALFAFVDVYSYLPFAASREPALNWGNPDNFRRIVDHVTARQYRQYVTASSQNEQIDAIFSYTTRDLGPRWLPLALLLALYGYYAAFKRDRTLFWLLLLMALACCAWMLVYPIVNDKDAYLLPAIVSLTIAAAYGAATLARGRVAVAAALLALPVLAAAVHWPYRDRSDFHVAKDFVDNTLRGIEPNSILITNNWQLWAPMTYFREAENVRRDVVPIEYGMLIRSWYVGQLERQFPALMTSVSKELAAYRPLLEISENNPRLWADPLVQEDFNKKLDDLVLAMIEKQIARGGHAYATFDVALSREAVDANLVRRVAAAYDVVPRGVALELKPGHQQRDVTLTPLELRGVYDGTVRYEPDDVVMTEVLPAYRNVTLIRARYLALTRKFDAAVAEYETARTLDPENPQIAREIQAVQMARGQS